MNFMTMSHFYLKLLFSKKSYILGSTLLSMSLSGFLQLLISQIDTEKITIPIFALLFLTVLTGIFILCDLILGIIASRHEGNRIQSSKFDITIGKFFGLFLYFVLSLFVIIIFSAKYLALVFTFGPLILTILKEYISIGENLERKLGKKIYMFLIIEKVFDILELKFFKTIDSQEICETNKEEKDIHSDTHN